MYCFAWKAVGPGGGHTAARELLARLYHTYVGGEMPEIIAEKFGKPVFSEGKYHFSISHTPHFAFCVLGDRPLGIDGEELSRTVSPRLAEKILSPGEYAQYTQAADKNRALLTFWVLKEARGKLLGTGIRFWPNDTDFQLSDPAVQEIQGCLVAIMEE